MDFLSPGHLVVIVIVAIVVLFGWKKLPEMTRSLGRSLRIFKTEMKAIDTDVRDSVTPAAAPATSAATVTAEQPSAPVTETR